MAQKKKFNFIKLLFLSGIIFIFTASPSYVFGADNLKVGDVYGTCTCKTKITTTYGAFRTVSEEPAIPVKIIKKSLQENCKEKVRDDDDNSDFVINIKRDIVYTDCTFKFHKVADITDELKISKPILGLTWPGLDFTKAKDTLWVDDDGRLYTLAPWLAEFIAAVYKFLLGIVSIVAVVMIIIEGIQMILSGTTIAVEGFDSKTGDKKSAISRLQNIARIMIGLFIAWTSYMILFQINPNLIKLKVLKTIYIKGDSISKAMLTDNSITESSDDHDENGGRETNNGTAVPYFSQRDALWRECDPEGEIVKSGCGITAVAMALKYLGVNTNPCDVYKKNDNRVGLYMGTLISQFKVNGNALVYKIFPKNQQAVGKVKECLDQNIPVLIYTTQEPWTKRYHFMVLTGYSGNTFRINDPNQDKKTMPANKVFSPNPPESCEEIFEREGRKKCPTPESIFPNFRIIYNPATHDSNCNPVGPKK